LADLKEIFISKAKKAVTASAVLNYSFQVPGLKAILQSVWIKFPQVYTGNVTFTKTNSADSNYNQTIEVKALTSATEYLKTDIGVLCTGAQNAIQFQTSTTCSSTGDFCYMEAGFFNNAY